MRIRDIRPAEYFSHLLKYKDGKFGHHPRWHYFVLNSQIQWRTLQKGKVYVKQSLNCKQYSIEELRQMVEFYSHMADRIVRFEEGLHGSR